jgi:1,2-dihydroxy-3-keto-5-methylthiopentene dioxygenase
VSNGASRRSLTLNKGSMKMAQLDYQGSTYTDPDKIASIMNGFGITYECWGEKNSSEINDEEVLSVYESEIKKLKVEKKYVTADLIALKPDTPNLETICEKFVKEHHHSEDEVRFCVAGEGVFELFPEGGETLKYKAEPGDLIVVPANARHLFYLTEKKSIRCIRLFKSQDGWNAIYDKKN